MTARHSADQGIRRVDDDIAPVDLQADPTHWLPGRALLVVAAIAVMALITTIIVCLVIWATPPMEPLQIPTVPRI